MYQPRSNVGQVDLARFKQKAIPLPKGNELSKERFRNILKNKLK
jgi:hypothetical protein